MSATPAGLIHLVRWFDQARALKHPAVRWVLAHAGQGGVHEAVDAEVPCIYWPISSDQPFLANQLAEVEKAGIELVQIRTGAAIGHNTARGITVEGTAAAIRDELSQVFKRMDSDELYAFEKQVRRIKGEWAKDAEQCGRQWTALRVMADL